MSCINENEQSEWNELLSCNISSRRWIENRCLHINGHYFFHSKLKNDVTIYVGVRLSFIVCVFFLSIFRTFANQFITMNSFVAAMLTHKLLSILFAWKRRNKHSIDIHRCFSCFSKHPQSYAIHNEVCWM